MVVSVLFHRFALLASVGGREELLSRPLALAPETGREQVVGEASPRAEAFGVACGMRVGEALGRCPELGLVAPDPERVRALWDGVLDQLERIGAGVESERPGSAFFDEAGLRGIHGGSLDGVLRAARRVAGGGARLGAGASRFVAWAAAGQASPRRRRGAEAPARVRGLALAAGGGSLVVPEGAERGFLAPRPVGLLRSRVELEGLCDMFERLGVRTLGELSELPTASVFERFGHPGLRALDLSHGHDSAVVPRRPPEPVHERLELPEAASGQQLEHALELLLARLLARPERRGRSLRALALSARLAAGGGWRMRATLRTPSADPKRLALALGRKLCELPGPATSLALEVEAFGPPAYRQEGLLADDERAAGQRARLADAVRQVRQAAGDQAALCVLGVDPDSRVPERRAVLAPFPAPPAPGESR